MGDAGLQLIRREDGAVVARDLRLAATFLSRLRGLMGRAPLAPGEGLWLEPCSSIHMMFVRFAIDVLFLRRLERGKVAAGASGEVLAVHSNVRPWIGLASCPGATSTIELSAGRAAEVGLRGGDTLRVEEVDR